ncbi:MAG: M20/M25/M40 family metallo-hydrolase [Lacticaseibacillus paracasei]|uniref:M20/M25/M40 family metallo-hydrolase n=1 Tax=Lacticaseibacillus paracasei TaxID=1597 RepID=UPI00345D3955
MDLQLMAALSNADAIASNEGEVRTILRDYLKPVDLKVQTDGLGSLIFTKRTVKPAFSVMIYGHMDEVGYMVRTITPEGLLRLMVVGGVKPLASHWQSVRVTTVSGKKLPGMVIRDESLAAFDQILCDVGANSAAEVAALGITIDDMVTFSTDFTEYAADGVFGGKALDDRLGCYVGARLLQELAEDELPFTLRFAATSSEEVGIRGAKTATQLIQPDLAFIVDVATFQNPRERSEVNQRQVGSGPILTHFDRTLAPNRTLQQFVKETAATASLPLQLDMFNGGGTDGGEAHKVGVGIPTVVTILPCRYGHCAQSLAQAQDVDQMVALYAAMCRRLTVATAEKARSF